jgi:hypothetical protein
MIKVQVPANQEPFSQLVERSVADPVFVHYYDLAH